MQNCFITLISKIFFCWVKINPFPVWQNCQNIRLIEIKRGNSSDNPSDRLSKEEVSSGKVTVAPDQSLKFPWKNSWVIKIKNENKGKRVSGWRRRRVARRQKQSCPRRATAPFDSRDLISLGKSLKVRTENENSGEKKLQPGLKKLTCIRANGIFNVFSLLSFFSTCWCAEIFLGGGNAWMKKICA